jgi:adenylylsulfate kinase
MHESHKRSIVKGITWRFVASVTTMLVVFIVTGNLALVASVGVVDVTLKIIFYYLHERFWGKVHWGILGTEPNLSGTPPVKS